ncbi:hypothetical protein PENTCL1PPCAC_10440, partial [Pristionchus entomophagus]
LSPSLPSPSLPTFPLLSAMSGCRSLFLLLLLLVALSVQEHQITFYDKETFDSLEQIDEVKAHFFIARFAQAEFESKCHGNDKPIVVPMYFHSGGTVELPCKMCEWGFVTNGLPKTWKHIPLHHATKFLDSPEKFLRDHADDANYVQSLSRSLTPAGGGFHRRARLLRWMYTAEATKDGAPVPPPQKIASIHNFVQSDGKLYIHGTMLESSGIYFCHDKKSQNVHTPVFFLLMAMAPLFHHSKATGPADMASIWNVDAWLSSGQDYEAKCTDSIRDPLPDEYAHMRYTPVELPAKGDPRLGTMPIDIMVAINSGGNRDQPTNLQIDHEPEEWTPCRKGETHKYREVHCVLKRKAGAEIPVDEFMTHEYVKWASSLNAYFKQFPSLRLHSYFITSLIYKGNTYGAEKNKDNAEPCDARLPKIWDYYKRTFLTALFGEGKGNDYSFQDDINTLIAGDSGDGRAILPFKDNNHACFELTANQDEKWWSIRGISFIEKAECP